MKYAGLAVLAVTITIERCELLLRRSVRRRTVYVTPSTSTLQVSPRTVPPSASAARCAKARRRELSERHA